MKYLTLKNEQKFNLLRKETLERLSSPERLDELIQVVSPKSWLLSVSLGWLVIVAILWSINGRIPITVEGQGILIYPSKVVPLQSKSSGQLLALNIKVGDTIRKGQAIATVDSLELRQQLQQQRIKLTELQSQDRVFDSLQAMQNQQDRLSIQQQRLYLQQRIQEVQALMPLLQAKGKKSIQQQRQGIKQRIREAVALTPVLKQRMEIRKQLRDRESAIAGDEVLQAEQEYLQNLEKISGLETQLKELDVKEVEQERAYYENLSVISSLRAQLKELDSREANLAQKDLEASTTRKKEIQEVKREIVQLGLRISNSSQIISQHSGRILELAVSPGQFINAGTRLGVMDTENSSTKLVGITFFSIADGKKIQPGMVVQITPQTVERERFGGIMGTVKTVSPFPITKEAAANLVGNPEVVEGLVSSKQSGVMQVSADLELDSANFSGYKWSSSSGPQLKISAGTTTTVRVKIEERAPITFVLPILRSVSGIY